MKNAMTRRELFGLLGLSLLLPAGKVRAAPRSRVVDVERGKYGTTITMELVHAPYPFKGKPYKDATTIAYVPHHYRLPASRKIDCVVHFHGHGTNARRAMKDHKLREQLIESKQNVVLLMPQGPMNASDGNIGKLSQKDGFLRFLTDVRVTLSQREVARALRKASFHRKARVGRVAVSAHSGGYHAAAMVITRGGFNVSEVYLFDALYGDIRHFREWVLETKKLKGSKKHKLMCFYAGASVKKQSVKLMKQLDEGGVEVLHEEKEGTLSRSEISSARAVFIRTRLGHSSVTSAHNALRDCLFASAFKRRLPTKWFKNSKKSRKLDKR